MGKIHSVAFLLLTLSVTRATSQQSGYQFISPKPGSSLIPCQSTITIRKGPRINFPPSGNSFSVRLTGSFSGPVGNRLQIADDQRTLIAIPDHAFSPGETVSVDLPDGLMADDGTPVGALHFSFRTRPEVRYVEQSFAESNGDMGITAPSVPHAPLAKTDSVPLGFPRIVDSVANTYPNIDIYLSDIAFSPLVVFNPYLMILSPNGTPRFYREMDARCYDFKWQPTGLMTYYDENPDCYIAMDSSFTVVDTFRTGNGYLTDLHDLRVLPDGHSLMMSYDPEPVRMDSVVSGGNPGATVIGLILQELDSHKNVVFQWRSWDHFAITDAESLNFRAATIDDVHGNAIEIDTDGNFIISSRYLSEITKIDRNTGDIIWRWGGKNNQFAFINDSIMFSYQHAVRRIANGHFVVFDNGNLRNPPYSRAVEYALDEDAKTATKVWEYRHSPDLFAAAMGYVNRLPDGSTLIGWGTADPSVTLIGPDKSTLAEISFPQGIYSYRAIAYPPYPGTITSGPPATTPLSFALWQNYPNPFNPSTTIRYQLPAQSRVSLVVYDILGQQVATLVNAEQQPGTHVVQWDAAEQASGVYFCRLVAGNNAQVEKMLLLR